MWMKRIPFIILCAVTSSALAGGVLYALNLRFGFSTRCSPSIPDIMVNSALKTALLLHKRDCGRFPTTAEGLKALLQPPAGQTNWKGPYLDLDAKRQSILDPWSRPYRYICPGVKNPGSYDLWSEGPDPYTEHDDIVNWPR